MIGYAMIGSNNLPRALQFYDAVLAVLGASRMMGDDKFQTYGIGFPSVGITLPYDGQPATVGNGNTFPQVYDALGRFVFVGLTADF